MKILRSALFGKIFWCASLPYRLAAAYKNHAYDSRVRGDHGLPVPVISVGNITAGGAGKTPLVMDIAARLADAGLHPVILSRGYKRRGRGIALVSDGQGVCLGPREAGDEPYMMAKRIKGAAVMVGRDRRAAAGEALRRLDPGALILDDGFQHRRMGRDLDIVVLDSSNPWGNGQLLPAGPLREPLKNLKRADLIVLSRADASDDMCRLKEQIGRYTDAPVVEAAHRPAELYALTHDTGHSLDFLKGRLVYAFSGIGNPDSFLTTLGMIGVSPAGSSVFRDHHWYSPSDIRKLVKRAEKTGAVALVTTEKDAVRISGITDLRLPVYVLRIDMALLKGEDVYEEAIRSAVFDERGK